jgi:ABC-type phosphonate transport system ATPase subunit
MKDLNTMEGMSVAMRKARMRNMYFHMSRAEDLDRLFKAAADDYDSGVLTGKLFEASCLTIVGESNSGKTEEIRHAMSRLQASCPKLECGRDVRSLAIFLDGETT